MKNVTLFVINVMKLFPSYRGLSNHLTFHRTKEIQENFEANRRERRSLTANRNRNLEIGTTHPHVFNEIAYSSRLSFPLEEGDGASAGVKPIVLTSVNGYADLKIPTANDSVPVTNVDLRQEIISAEASSIFTYTSVLLFRPLYRFLLLLLPLYKLLTILMCLPLYRILIF